MLLKITQDKDRFEQCKSLEWAELISAALLVCQSNEVMMHATDVSYPFVSFVVCSFLFCLFVLQLNKFEMKSRLSRFIAEDPLDLLLPREEAIRLSTEAFRLWAVAAGYGQACDLYRYSPKLEK